MYTDDNYFTHIKQKLIFLFQRIQILTPPGECPKTTHCHHFVSIINCIAEEISIIERKIDEQKKINDEKCNKIKELEYKTGEKSGHVDLGQNLCINSELLNNEISRLQLFREGLKAKIEHLKKRSEEICDEINVEPEKIDEDTPMLVQIELLREKCAFLLKEKELRERTKHEKVTEITKLLEIMEKKEFDDVETCILEMRDVKIGQVELKLGELQREHDRRIKKISELDKKISTVKKFLVNVNLDEEIGLENDSNFKGCKNIMDISFSNGISEINMSRKEHYLDLLEKIKCSMFKKIFSEKLAELKEINRIFKMEMDFEVEETEECLQKIDRKIEEMHPKTELLTNIISLDEMRKEILKAMVDFEKVASDPRRLFKSSFQLLKEEKFRKGAGPSLMKIEKQLLEKIEEYESQFGTLIYEGEYKNRLLDEINKRIINRSVFVLGGVDSPKKRKRL